MATYNGIINRENAAGLLSVEESNEIIQNVREQSTFLQLAKRLPNMSAKTREYPIQLSEPIAGFVDGDTGLKPVTDMKWGKKSIVAEEIAAIIPVPDNVAADSNFDIFAQLRPQLEAAAAKVIDKAVFFGTNKPTSWPEGIVPAAIAAGNVVYTGTSEDMYKNIFGIGGVISQVEEDGYFVDGIVSAVSTRAKLRELRDSSKRPIFLENMQNAVPYTLNGVQMVFPRNGAFDGSVAQLIAGDFQQAVYAIRQDVTFDVFNSGVISDDNGKVIYNLMQNDMKAIRMVIRLGWQVFNPLNGLNANDSTRYPFAVYSAKASAVA